MDSLHEAEHWEELRHTYEGKMNAAMHLRNFNIKDSFNNGYSQKEIGNALGLSESTIKHIIARMKKNEQ